MAIVKNAKTDTERPNPANQLSFDPLLGLLLAKPVSPEHLAALDVEALTPFQRSLLMHDGTVTTFIESYMLDRIEIDRIGQSVRLLPDEHTWLEASGGEEVISREVLLRGKRNQTLYGHAISLTLLGRLPRSLRDELAIEGSGIGRLLLKNHVEQRREILWYGLENLENLETLPPALLPFNAITFISRIYRIIVGGKPVSLINERFPIHRQVQL